MRPDSTRRYCSLAPVADDIVDSPEVLQSETGVVLNECSDNQRARSKYDAGNCKEADEETHSDGTEGAEKFVDVSHRWKVGLAFVVEYHVPVDVE